MRFKNKLLSPKKIYNFKRKLAHKISYNSSQKMNYLGIDNYFFII